MQELLAAERMPVARDHGIWARRYREINDWERYLVDNGIHVVKVMLNLSKREQAKRFLKRITTRRRTGSSRPSASGSGATGSDHAASALSRPC